MHAAPTEPRRTIQPGTAGFTVLISMATALTALAIDTVLPAFPDIREALDLPSDSTQVAALVTVFLMGQGIGVLPAGLLADRFGRRPVLWGGLAIYVAGALLTVLAPTIQLMILARLIWGFGAAGPRVATMAMVRDTYEGDEMAAQMSLIMAVFLIVPTLAPALGTGLLAVGSWEWVYLICAVAGVAVLVASTRLPATMPVGERRAISVDEVRTGIWTVVSTPGSLGYLIAMTVGFGAFMSYLGSSEIIIDEVFGLRDWFAVIFGGVAIAMAAAMLLNGRIVAIVGLRRMLWFTVSGLLVSNAVSVVVAVASDGTPPFALYLFVITVLAMFQQMLGPNVNAAYMQPLGNVAGLAAALIAMLPMVLGAIIGNVINDAYDGTIKPLAFGFAASGVISALALYWSHRATEAEPSEPTQRYTRTVAGSQLVQPPQERGSSHT